MEHVRTNRFLTHILPVIGAMLSKLCKFEPYQQYGGSNVCHVSVLILGMCFFAGGMRFTQQDFDSSTSSPSQSIQTNKLTHRLYSCDANSLLSPQP